MIENLGMATDYLTKARAYKDFHYSELKIKELDYLHKRTLEMFKEVKRIFEENGIQYMICGGTLLGALGGMGGFIPWDDDFDVCILEEDYERAADCLIKGLSNGCELQCTRTDSNYYLGWMKIRDKHSHVYPDCPCFKENGVWIDLYKLVSAERKNVPMIIAQENIDYLDRRLAAKGLTQKEYEERIAKGALRENLDYEKKRALDSTDTRQVYIIWSASKITINKEWVFPIRKVDFEDICVTTFYDAEEYLKIHYGENYAEFPPDELRRVGINKVVIEE